MPFTDFERDPEATTGVMWSDFVTAVGIWVYTNEDLTRLSVAEAALAFNTTPELVREAIDEHPWLDWRQDDDPAKQYISTDGE
jgi:hypothetical protein